MEYFWPRYVSVGERRAKARQLKDRLRKKGMDIKPIEIEGRAIARSFWGKGWCKHLESFSDYANRLPRGRSYVRHHAVCHLEIQSGRVEAMVSGTDLYKVTIEIKKLEADKWQAIKQRCAGQIGSMLELLRGSLSNEVMGVVTDRENGLFPLPGEITLKCSCPDWAAMCKHVAAVLYGVGSRLDHKPDLLFLLRGVDAEELISAEMALHTDETAEGADIIAEDQLGDIFGVELEQEPEQQSKPKPENRKKPGRPRKKSAPKKPGRPRKKTSATKKPGRPRKSQTALPSPAHAKKNAKEKKPAQPADKSPTGKSVARLRQKLGLSATEFAEKLGVSAASVYRWEKTPGRLNLHERTLNAIADLEQRTSKK
ncbi:MAG: helix-turn-helix domain-containing protein [bacterium]